MQLPDVNILVYAHREDSEYHTEGRDWLVSLMKRSEPYAIGGTVIASLVRIVTHPRIFDPPSTVEEAWAFAGEVRRRPKAVEVYPRPGHLDLVEELCRATGARGNLVPDADLAALAIENGCELVTTDGDVARFPGLRWRHPFRDAPR